MYGDLDAERRRYGMKKQLASLLLASVMALALLCGCASAAKCAPANVAAGPSASVSYQHHPETHHAEPHHSNHHC